MYWEQSTLILTRQQFLTPENLRRKAVQLSSLSMVAQVRNDSELDGSISKAAGFRGPLQLASREPCLPWNSFVKRDPPKLQTYALQVQLRVP
jgi:hypothetical protein